MLRTRLTDRFDLKYPVLSAPMANHSGGRLAAAISQAGGLGTFGGTTSGGAEWLLAQVALARDTTDAPIGVGFLTHRLELDEAAFAAALEAEVPVLVFSFADPATSIARAKTRGITSICQVQTVAGADEAVAAGADVLIAQGHQAGGHSGPADLFWLLPAILDRHPAVPVLAAGGIASARLIAAALAAGADGVMMGTRFLATPEAVEVSDEHKRVIVTSDGNDTVFSSVFDTLTGAPWPGGIGARGYRNKFIDRWHGHEAELERDLPQVRAQHAEAIKRDGVGASIVYMGVSAGAIDSVQPVATVLADLFGATERLLAERASALLGR